jgi:SAM-dependent methyltransferase
LDDVTRIVRAQYEAFPYPDQPDGVVADVHPDLMLSYLESSRPGPWQILDAGCGTGMACLGTALCNPLSQETAVDLNRVALERVQRQADALNLKNLRLVEADLMRPESIPVPEGGYDLIISSGVLHHLSDPGEALKGLAGLLGASGVLRLMVYNRWGRQALYRFVQAFDLICPRDRELPERLHRARRLLESLLPGAANARPWDDGALVSDVELVDRYLHPNDVSYDVPAFLELARQAGLKMLRWYEPRHWRAGSVVQGPLAEELDRLPYEQLWSAIELLGHRKQLDALFCRPEAIPRDAALGHRIAISPQVTWLSGRRIGGGTLVTFVSSVVVRDEGERILSAPERAVLECLGPARMDLGRLEEMLRPFLEAQAFRETLRRLLSEEILYCPLG